MRALSILEGCSRPEVVETLCDVLWRCEHQDTPWSVADTRPVGHHIRKWAEKMVGVMEEMEREAGSFGRALDESFRGAPDELREEAEKVRYGPDPR